MTPKLKMTQQRKQNAPTQWLNKTRAFIWLCQELLPGICLSCIKFQGKIKLSFWSRFQQFFLLTYEQISHCESSSIPMVKIFFFDTEQEHSLTLGYFHCDPLLSWIRVITRHLTLRGLKKLEDKSTRMPSVAILLPLWARILFPINLYK